MFDWCQTSSYHLSALKKLGMNYEIKDGYIHAKSNKLQGKVINFQGKCWRNREYNFGCLFSKGKQY